MTSLNLLVIGGVAAGASFAARARRLDEHARITILERGPDVSFANCGLPYHIGGEIPERDALAVQTPQSLKNLLNLDVRTGTEAIAIDRAGKRVRVRDMDNGREDWLAYDRLMLAPGASPVIPPLDGVRDPRILTLRNLADMDRVTALAVGGRRAVIVGAGFIGLEMAEQLRGKGLAVTLVELQPHVLPQMDGEMTRQLAGALRANGVTILCGEQVARFTGGPDGVRVHLASGPVLDADMVLLSVGVRPETALARDAGLTLGPRGHIAVDGFMRTSDPFIYAAGDAVETDDRVLPGRTSVPLGGPANRQGRVAADHVLLGDRARPYPGSVGTAIVRGFGVAAGVTGWTAQRLAGAGIDHGSVTVNAHQHASYYPGATPITLKICWDTSSGRLLGAEATGEEGVDKRLDVLATAIAGRMTVEDLCHLELAYAPPFGSAKDIVNLAGFAATNIRDGLMVPADALPTDPSVQLVDVRPKPLSDAWPVEGAIAIPFATLRSSLDRLDRDRPVVTLCAFGKMSYFAARVLSQNGFDVSSLPGGVRANIDPAIPSKA